MIDYITQIDFSILYWIQDIFKCRAMDVLMWFFSFIEENGMVWIVLSVVLICFKKTRYCGFAVLIAMAVDTILAEGIIKNIVCRVRPCYQVPDFDMIITRPDSYSFPSNHSASSFAAATAIFLTIKRKVWSVPAFILAGIISFSRLYLFVHFPSDVIAGIIFGILVAIVVCYFTKKVGIKSLFQKT